MYNITDYSRQQAKKLGVKIKPSTKKSKKIDVFNNQDKFITSIGAAEYKSYPEYLNEKGKSFADERRRLYRLRHRNDINVKGSAGFFANKLLW